MKNRTITIIVPTSSELVFSFLSNIENLPLWATEFCQSVRRDGTNWKVQTPQGEMFFDIHADKQTGVLDMMAGSGPDDLGRFLYGLFPGGRLSSLHHDRAGSALTDHLFESRLRQGFLKSPGGV